MSPLEPEFQGREIISDQEELFERYRHKIGLVLGPALAILLYLLPMSALSVEAHKLAAILAMVVVWWVCEPVPLPVTALLGVVLIVVFGVSDAKKALAPLADPTIYLFFGSFILAKAMAVHKLDRWFAYKVLRVRWLGNSKWSTLFLFGAVCAFISMWVSNTATTAMMYPIAMGVIVTLSKNMTTKTGSVPMTSFATALLLMTAYSASLGGIGTPVGTPPNLIGIAMMEKLANIHLRFFQWVAIALPMLVIMYFVLFFLLYLLHRKENVFGIANQVNIEYTDSGWTPGRRNTLIAFGVTVVLWILPGILAAFMGTKVSFFTQLNARIPEAIAALIGAILLFLLPTNWQEREFTINWRQATDIDWGTLILFGGGLTLGSLMFETKLAETIGTGLLHFSGVTSVWGITAIAILLSILVSEISSNTSSANMVIPVMIALAKAAQVDPLPPAIGATLGASWGFMLPVSTPPNAIIYGSGAVPITKMIRAGILFDIIGGVLIWLGLRILLPLLGWM